MMDVNAITDRILRINTETADGDLSSIRADLDAIKAAVRQAEAMLQVQMIEWINCNGDLMIGDIRYYVGKTTKTKCRDNAKTIEALLTAAEGDVESVASYLSSQPWKHGACRTALGEAFDECFEVTEDIDVKTGKPLKSVKSVDTSFISKGEGSK